MIGKMKFPIAEQMIDWLEEKYHVSFNVYETNISWLYHTIYKNHIDSHISDEEATLAAIDAALKYLVGNDLIK